MKFKPPPPSLCSDRVTVVCTSSGARPPSAPLGRRPFVLGGHQPPLAGGAGGSGAAGGAAVRGVLTLGASSAPPLPLHQII